MKTFISLFVLTALPICCLAQITLKDTARLPLLKDAVKTAFKQAPTFEQAPTFDGSRLDRIGKELKSGSKTALLAIAPYLDDTSRVTRFLGYHIFKPQQRDVAISLLMENASFLQSEINLNTKTSAAEWLKFTEANFDKIAFDTDAGVFLLTPMSRRDVQFEALELTYLRQGDLHRAAGRLLNLPWLKDGDIDMLIGLKDNYALYKIAARLYRTRTRFNDYQDDGADYINLLQLLTGVDIGVKNEKGEITHHIEKDYSLQSRENLLIYFVKNYEAFKWDENKKSFVNEALQPGKRSTEANYFEQLSSKTDSLAMSAFIALSTSDTVKVRTLAKEYDKAGMRANYTLPTFPYRFLEQLSLLTSYCKNNKIDFEGSARLHVNIFKLKSKLSFQTRRKMEDAMINKLSLNEVTALEYWSLIFENNAALTYSSGRILDIWYSKNWYTIISSEKQLNLFLKKSVLFRNLGISGFCYNYLAKFNNADEKTIASLKRRVSPGIPAQRALALSIALSSKPLLTSIKKYNGGNYDAEVKDLKQEFNKVIKAAADTQSRNDSISKLFAKINYSQVGTAIILIDKYTFKWPWEKYSFMDRDFGFFLGDFNSAGVRAEFLNIYATRSEYQTYAYYLKKGEIDYLNQHKTLDYDKIYNILKYNVVTAFVGGGGGWKLDNEVYAIIKLLELTFKTRLGFPTKLCNSGNSYGCHSSDRAKEWMNYLKEKGLLKLPHNEPYSFSYFDN